MAPCEKDEDVASGGGAAVDGVEVGEEAALFDSVASLGGLRPAAAVGIDEHRGSSKRMRRVTTLARRSFTRKGSVPSSSSPANAFKQVSARRRRACREHFSARSGVFARSRRSGRKGIATCWVDLPQQVA